MEQQQAAAEQHTAGGGGNAAEARRRAKQAAGVVPMQNADWTGLDWIGSIDEWMVWSGPALCSLLMAAQWPPRRRARPRFSEIELEPPLWSPELG